MQRFEARIGQLARWSAGVAEAYCKTFAPEVPKEHGYRVGKLYGIIEAAMPAKIGDAATAHIEDALLQGIDTAIRTLPASAPAEAIFKRAIARINGVMGKFFADDRADYGERVSATLVAQRGFDLLIAIWGRPYACIFRREASGLKTIVIPTDDDAGPVGFRSVLEGTIEKNDRLLFSTRDLRQYLNEAVLGETATTNDPETAATALRNLTSKASGLPAFALTLADAIDEESAHLPRVIVEPMSSRTIETKAADVEPVQPAAPTSEASLSSLIQRRNETQEILSPSISAMFGGLVGRVKRMAKLGGGATSVADAAPRDWKKDIAELHASCEEQVNERRAKIPSDEDAIASFRQAWSEGLHANFVEDRAHDIVRARKPAKTGAMDSVVAKLEFVVEPARALIAKTNIAPMISKIPWPNLTFMKSKHARTALAGVAAIAIISIGVSAFSRKPQTTVKVDVSALSSALTQKLNDAEASLIYHDRARAKTLLDEAAASYAVIAAQPVDKKNPVDYTPFKKRIDQFSNELNLVTELSNEQPIPLPADAGVATHIGLLKNATLVSTATGNAYIIGTDGKTTALPSLGSPVTSIANADDKTAYVATKNGGIWRATADGKAVTLPFSKPISALAVNDMAFYQGKLFILDAQHNRILRFPLGDSAIGAATIYPKDGTDVSASTSLAVDGTIFALRNDGVILPLIKGIRRDMTIEAPSPGFSSAAVIRTSETMNSIYILDGAQDRRILRFDKRTGVLLAQYRAPSISAATDFVVMPDESGIVSASKAGAVYVAIPQPK